MRTWTETVSIFTVTESRQGCLRSQGLSWAQAFIEKEVQPYQWRNIERFRKEVVNGRVIVMRGTNHYFFKDLKRKDEVVREMRDFLLSK